MLRIILLSLLALSCSKDKPAPIAPASKITSTEDAPQAPTNLHAEALTDTSVMVAWDASEGATDYDINYKTLAGRWTNWPIRKATETTIYTLKPNTEYRWAVRAENRDGASSWVFGENFTTLSSDSLPPNKPLSLKPQIYNDNVFVLPVAENLIEFKGHVLPVMPVADYAQRFYEHFDDEFDFLVFIPNFFVADVIAHADSTNTGQWAISSLYHHTSNEIEGIGRPIENHSFEYGSERRLQGVIKMGVLAEQNDSSTPTYLFSGPFLHEIMHRWANYIIEPHPHWPFSNINGYLWGYPDSLITDHGNSQYSAKVPYGPENTYTVGSQTVYAPLELYLAGLIPPDEVPDIWTAYGEREYQFPDEYSIHTITATRTKTYTIQDIIDEHGPRIPDYTQSQKNFRVAVILLIGENYPADTRRLAWLSEDVSLMSRPGPVDQYRFYNFYEATVGRATLTTDGLSNFKRNEAAKRVAPKVFQALPPPIQ